MFIEGKNLVKKYGKGEATVFALDHTDFRSEEHTSELQSR